MDNEEENEDYDLLENEEEANADYLYNLQIVREYNRETHELFKDIQILDEISKTLSEMVYEQGEKIDLIENNVEETVEILEQSVQSLEKSNEYVLKARKNIRNAAIIIGGATAGTLGFIAGPIVGLATTISGIVASVGIVFAAEKSN